MVLEGGGANANARLRAQRNGTCGGAFTVTEDDAPRSSNAAGSLRATSTIDALIALQGVEDRAPQTSSCQRPQRAGCPRRAEARRTRRKRGSVDAFASE